MKNLILILLLSMPGISASYAQVILSGKVYSKRDSSILAMATIQVMGQKEVQSDGGGNYRIDIQPGKYVLLVSHVGYKTLTISREITVSAILDVFLEPAANMLDEVTVVSTGYQQVPKDRAAGSFTVIPTAKLNEQVSTDLLSRLEAVTNGFSIDRKTNGGGGYGMMIRGLSTIQGPRQPLIILDNFPYDGDLNAINPNDVDQITILKDASAASIWGARAGNGVIVITTKRARLNKSFKVDFNSNVSIGTIPDLFYQKQMTASEFIDVEKMLFTKGHYTSAEASVNKPALSPVVELLIAARDGKLSMADAENRINALRQFDLRKTYMDDFYQKPVNQQYSMQLSSGGTNSAWLMSVGYDSNSDELAAGFDRLNLKLNQVINLGKRVQLSNTLQYTSIRTENGKPAYNSISNVAGGKLPPYTFFRNADGSAVSVMKDLRSGYTATAGNGRLLDWNYYPLTDYLYTSSQLRQSDVQLGTSLDYKLPAGFTLKALFQHQRQQGKTENLARQESYAMRDMINRYTQINGSTVQYPVPLGARLATNDALLKSYNGRMQLGYDKQWPQHELVAFAGAEIRKTTTESASNTIYGYDEQLRSSIPVNYTAMYPSFVNGSNLAIGYPVSQTLTDNRFISFMANAAYTYKDRYTLSASARKDASNLFGVSTNNRWTPLWSAGMVWNIAKEPFFASKLISQLKLRATYGYSGNTDARRAAVTTIIGSGTSTYTLSPYSSFNNFYNPQLRWEKVRTLNLGLDFKLLNDRVWGSAEFYHKKGTDLFGLEEVDYTTGIGNTVLKNAASMAARGWDIELNSINIPGKISWTSQAFINVYKDKVLDYYINSYSGRNFLNGHLSISAIKDKPVYAMYSYPWAGLDPATGDPMGMLNGQQSKTYSQLTASAITIYDLVYHGPSFPALQGGFGNTVSWKGLSLSAQIGYKFGHYFRKPVVSYTELYNSRNVTGDFGSRWKQAGDEKRTNIPSMIYPNTSARDAFYQGTEVNVIKGDHVRLRYINLSYQGAEKWLGNKFLKNLQLYATVNNLGIIWKSNEDDIDPDYPAVTPAKIISMGLRAGF